MGRGFWIPILIALVIAFGCIIATEHFHGPLTDEELQDLTNLVNIMDD